MLRLTLEIVPFGSETLTRPIGMLSVALRRVDPNNHGEYHVYRYSEIGELIQEFDVRDHPRADGAWELIRRAVEGVTQPETLRNA